MPDVAPFSHGRGTTPAPIKAKLMVGKYVLLNVTTFVGDPPALSQHLDQVW